MKPILVVVVTAVLVVLAFIGGTHLRGSWPEGKTRAELLAEGSCDLPIEKGVELSDGDLCVIKAIAERCGELDQCFVDCFTTGRGQNIGGGCAHLCNYGWKKDWRAPDDAKQCYGEGEKSFLSSLRAPQPRRAEDVGAA